MKTTFATVPSISRGMAARMLGVSIDAVKNLAKKGVVTTVVTPTGRHMLTPSEVQKAHDHFAAKQKHRNV